MMLPDRRDNEVPLSTPTGLENGTGDSGILLLLSRPHRTRYVGGRVPLPGTSPFQIQARHSTIPSRHGLTGLVGHLDRAREKVGGRTLFNFEAKMRISNFGGKLVRNGLFVVFSLFF